MIKKTITVLSMLILSATLIWAVWEGNAAMGSQEEFPAGLFASSDLFPKYTLIEISNLEQNIKSRAVIIGDTGSDGLLVKVSPDLAKALAIKAGSTVRVRVSIPPLVAEEGADPVLLGKVGNKQPDSSETPTLKDSVLVSEGALAQEDNAEHTGEPPVKSEPASQKVVEPVQPMAEKEEEFVEPMTVAEAAPIQPEPVFEEPIAPIAEVAEPVLPDAENVPAPAAVSEVTEPTDSPAQSEYSAEAEKPVVQVAEIVVPEDTAESDESPIPEVSTPIEPQPVAIDETEPAQDTEELVNEPELLATEAEEAQPEILTSEAEEAQPELLAAEAEETEPEQGDEPQNEPEVVAVEVLPEDDNAEDTFIESHVMLVPAEPREPVGEYIPVPKKTEKPAIPASPVVTRPAEESYTANALTKGAFYVQVGRFKDILNVESFVQMYGKQYPVAIEKSSTAKDDFYKVYVGPLQKDERGATLETFQKLGYKDAFLKKAP